MKKISFGEIKTKVKDVAYDVKDHWNVPKEGNYVPYKEIMYLCLGSSGSTGINNVLKQVCFAASCFLVGSIYGITFTDIYVIGILSMVMDYISQPMIMAIQDNLGRPPKKTMLAINIVNAVCVVLGLACLFIPKGVGDKIVRALPQLLATTILFSVFKVYFNLFMFRVLAPRFGKFRPWVMVGSLPSIVCIILMAFLPINDWDYSKKLWVVNLIFAFYSFFGCFHSQVSNIMNTMTPSSQERAAINVIETFVQGLIGSGAMLALPLLTVYTGGMTSIDTYRYIIPAIVLLFTPLMLLQVFKVKERVIIPEGHKANVSMFKGMKQVLRNKYLWALNLRGFFGQIANGCIVILDVMVVYSLRVDYLLGLLTNIAGGFCTAGLFFIPWTIKKLGKKKTFLYSTALELIAFGLQVVGVYTNQLVILFFGIGAFNFLAIFADKAHTLMTPDVWDYQQFISGERLEASMGIYSLILSPFAKILALTIPTVYALAGFSSDWGVLYFEDVRSKVFLYSILATLGSKILGIIPFLFYDLTEEKHKKIIEELKKRAGIGENKEETEESPAPTEEVPSEEIGEAVENA